MHKIVNYSTIYKRQQCLSSSFTEDTKSNERFNSLVKLLESNPVSYDGRINQSVQNSLRSFIESMTNKNSASKYYSYPIYIMQEINNYDQELSNHILSDYTGRILPYVEDVSNVNEAIERYSLTSEQYNSIKESTDQIIIADRILNNHNMISKKFPVIETNCKLVNSIGLRSVIESCCKLIDTYNLESYKKMNICIEEMSYIFGKNNINYDKKEFVKLITEHFLIESDSENEINKFKKVLTESYCLDSQDLRRVGYLFRESEDPNYTPRMADYINDFYSSPKSRKDILDSLIMKCLSCSFSDIKMNIDKLLWAIFDNYEFMWRIGYDNDPINNITDCSMRQISGNISNIILNSSEYISSEDIDTILDKFNTVEASMSNLIRNNNDLKYNTMIITFKQKLENAKNDIIKCRDIVYPEDNIKAMNLVNCESTDLIPIKEFKIFKFHNLVNAAINLDKFLKDKSKKIYNSGSKKYRKVFTKVKDVLFGESTNIYSYIGEDNRVDITVGQYYIDEDYLSEIHDLLNETCREFNNQLDCQGNYSTRAYYIINPGIAEVHLKESSILELDEIDKKSILESDIPSLDVYINNLALFEACADIVKSFDESKLISIKDRLSRFNQNPNLTIEHYEVAMEALSLLSIDQNDVNIFTEKFIDYSYSSILESCSSNYEINQRSSLEKMKINTINQNWVHEENVPLDIQLEAYLALCAVLEDVKKPQMKKPEVGAKKIEDNKSKNAPVKNIKDMKDDKNMDNQNMDQNKDKKKNPFSGLSLNSIRLYIEGLKAKMKDMSSKEKEISRNLDNNFTRLVKSMKSALISDRREAIIKGSVIPSFSRCIKICIGLAGLGIATGNPMIPLLTAIGGFAVSKNLTKKERILLLDEIETELEVVDKEISMAESKNQIKKYRALLKYKKDLQRQYQRIKYNVRVGKDILPNSAAGIKNSND
nr:MAG TPA: hypothetical protein [Herelleviridae sp.]